MAKMDIKLITRHTEYFVIAALFIIIVIMLISLTRSPKNDLPSTSTIDISKIPFPRDAMNEVKMTFEGLKPLDQSNYQKDLLQRNLFSFRDVLSKQAIEKEIIDKLKKVETLFTAGDYQQVISLCDEILKTDANRAAAQVYKEKAQKALQPTGANPTVPKP